MFKFLVSGMPLINPLYMCVCEICFRSGYLILNLSLLRDQHLYNTDPLYLPEEKAFVTETQVIRETLW